MQRENAHFYNGVKPTSLQVGVKALLRSSSNSLLLLRRSDKYQNIAGSWDMPGGRIDPEEPLLTALKREVGEETGLSYADTPILIGAQDIFPAEDKHVVRLTFLAQIDGEKVVLSEESSEFTWVTKEELLKLEDLDVFLRGLLGEDRVTGLL